MAHKYNRAEPQEQITRAGALEAEAQARFEARLGNGVGLEWVGGTLRVLCEEQGLSIRELEDEIDPRVLGRLFTGALRDRSYYAVLASKLGCSMDAVFERASALEARYGHDTLAPTSYDTLARFLQAQARARGYKTRSSYERLLELSTKMYTTLFREPQAQPTPLMYYLFARALGARPEFDAFFDGVTPTTPKESRGNLATAPAHFGVFVFDARGACYLVQPLIHERTKTRRIPELDLPSSLNFEDLSITWHERARSMSSSTHRQITGALLLISGTSVRLASLMVPILEIDLAGTYQEIVGEHIRCNGWLHHGHGDLVP